MFKDKHRKGINTELEKKLYDDCSTIITALEENSLVIDKFAYFKMEDLEKLSKAITEAFSNLKQPSYLTCLLSDSMSKVFSYVYGMKPRDFGTCT